MNKLFLPGCALAGCVTSIGADKVSPRTACRHLHANALNSGAC